MRKPHKNCYVNDEKTITVLDMVESNGVIYIQRFWGDSITDFDEIEIPFAELVSLIEILQEIQNNI